MLNIALQSIKYYLENNKIPSKNEIDIKDTTLLSKTWSLFITIYKNWNIVWSSWNIKETLKNDNSPNSIVDEIILNSIFALQDERFEKISLNDLDKIKIRIDVISKKLLNKENSSIKNQILNLNPAKSWIIVIKNDYTKLSVILPNISPTLVNWQDLINTLSNKLDEEFIEENYITYEINSHILTNY